MKISRRRFRDLPDALLAKSVLESAEIECCLADDIAIRMNWFWSYAMGEIKMRVREADAVSSDDILKLEQNPPESLEFGNAEIYVQPLCPNCQAFDIWHRELLRWAYVTLLLFWFSGIVPAFPFRRHGWRCHACDHQWSDD